VELGPIDELRRRKKRRLRSWAPMRSWALQYSPGSGSRLSFTFLPNMLARIMIMNKLEFCRGGEEGEGELEEELMREKRRRKGRST
jgi:hypothetical protein